MTRAELAKELRRYRRLFTEEISIVGTDALIERPIETLRQLICALESAAAYLEDDSKLHEACDLMESLKEFPERMRLERDARRWRALDTLLERYPDKRPSWDIRHAIRVLVKLDKRELLDIGAVCPSAALDAYIAEHSDVG